MDDFLDGLPVETSSTATIASGSTGGAGLGLTQTESKEGKTKLQAWQEERQQVLNAKRKKAEETKAALLAQASQEIKQFYASREEKIAKQKQTNRADESASRKDMESLMRSGTRWEKVNKLVNVGPKPSEKAGGARLDRMRKLILQLKTTKDEDEKRS